jgi:murein DD-endopeptidase MepM/ murein hydrolase activator NlpD
MSRARLVLASPLVLALAACSGAPPAPRTVEAREVVPAPDDPAVAVVRALNGPDRAAAYAMFGAGFQDAKVRDEVMRLLDDVGANLGPLASAEVLRRERLPGAHGLARATVRGAHQRGQVEYGVVLDAAGVVVGLTITRSDDAPGPADDYVSKTAYGLPALGRWKVTNGGRARKTNVHVGNVHQWYALDLVQTGPDGKSHRGDGRAVEDYYAWGQTLVAPADGVVVVAVDGVPDNPPGVMDKYFVPGNLVTIDHGGGEHSYLAHFQRGSVLVRPGDRVRRGQPLGRVGNSGNSSEPHIHWHVANMPVMHEGHGLPIRLDGVMANSQPLPVPVPVRGDVLEPAQGGRAEAGPLSPP